MRSRRLPTLLLAVLALAAPASAMAAGRAIIEISGANFRPLPLAMPAISGPKEAAPALDAALREDLAISGLFQILDPKSYLAAATEGLVASTIDFSKWRAVGAEMLVKGSVTVDGKVAKAELRLFDVVKGAEVLKASLSAPVPDSRTLAHTFADQLWEYFTGEKGAFRTKLAFVRKSGTAKEIWMSDFDGHGAVALTSAGGLNLLPSWSPDGRQVLFTAYRDGSPMLYFEDIATKAVRGLLKKGDLQTGGAFSPDGKKIAFTMSEAGNSDIFVANADGSGLVNLTNSRDSESSPSWSPDGKKIAFVSARSGDPHIFAMNADGSGVERLTLQGKYNQTPDWSPRGDQIVFTARDERNVFDIFVIDPGTKKITRLTQDQGHNEDPSYSPNGRHIIFTSTRDGRKRLFVMGADGTNQHLLGVDGEVFTPAWGPWAQ